MCLSLRDSSASGNHVTSMFRHRRTADGWRRHASEVVWQPGEGGGWYRCMCVRNMWRAKPCCGQSNKPNAPSTVYLLDIREVLLGAILNARQHGRRRAELRRRRGWVGPTCNHHWRSGTGHFYVYRVYLLRGRRPRTTSSCITLGSSGRAAVSVRKISEASNKHSSPSEIRCNCEA